MSERMLEDRVFASLNTAVDENGHTDLLTHAPEAVAIDLLTADGLLSEEDHDPVDIALIVEDWQLQRRGNADGR